MDKDYTSFVLGRWTFHIYNPFNSVNWFCQQTELFNGEFIRTHIGCVAVIYHKKERSCYE